MTHRKYEEPAKDVERDLPALLRRWQLLGVYQYRDPEWDSPGRDAEASALGVTSAHRSNDTSFPGTIYPLIELPREQAGGIVADSGDGLVDWAIPWISDPVRSDNLDKLRRSGKPQRHMFVFIPPWTTAPWPAVDVLLRHDGPPLPTTSPVLPDAVTHLWFASGWSVPCVENQIEHFGAKIVNGARSAVQGTINAMEAHEHDTEVMSAASAVRSGCTAAVAYWALTLRPSQLLAVVADSLRRPDYVSVTLSGFSEFYGLGGDLVANFGRNGAVYAGFGGGFGIPGGGFSAMVGWIDQLRAPSATTVNNFISGGGLAFNANIPLPEDFTILKRTLAVSEVWGRPGKKANYPGGWGTEVGIGPSSERLSGSVTYSYTWRVSRSGGVKW
jgi:hypothetical protein